MSRYKLPGQKERILEGPRSVERENCHSGAMFSSFMASQSITNASK